MIQKCGKNRVAKPFKKHLEPEGKFDVLLTKYEWLQTYPAYLLSNGILRAVFDAKN